MISPTNKIKQIWDVLVGILILTCALVTPLNAALDIESVPAFQESLLIFNHLITLIFVIDIVLNFFTAIYLEDELITNRKMVAKHYLKTWFSVDFLSTLPVYLISGNNNLYMAFRTLRLFRLLRLLRVIKLWKQLSWRMSQMIHSGIAQMFFLFFWVPLGIHWLVCGWLAIEGIEYDKDIVLNYVRGLYWCITTVTTVGYGDITPDQNSAVAMLFNMFVMILGAGMYGYVIGNVANMLAKRDITKINYMEKMDRINAFLKYQEIPDELQKRVRDYYNFLWRTRRGYDEDMILEELPAYLKVEVALHLKKEIIEKVPIFKGCGDKFIRALVMVMKPAVFLPNDYIIRTGDVGEEMYFISRGSVDVFSADESTKFATLQEGSFFGEIALLKKSPRTATIKAAEYCDLYCLSKDHFDSVRSKFPEFENHIQQVIQNREEEAKSHENS